MLKRLWRSLTTRFHDESDEPDYCNGGYDEETIALLVREKFKDFLPRNAGTFCHSRVGPAQSGYYKGYVVGRGLMDRRGVPGMKVKMVRLDTGQRITVPRDYYPQLGELVLAERDSKRFIFVPTAVFAENWSYLGGPNDRLRSLRVR